MITIRQGESYRIIFNLNQDGQPLVPEMIQDLKICIGDELSKVYSAKGVRFDVSKNKWYIFPTQQETLSLNPGKKKVCCHIKYHDTSVIIHELDTIQVLRGCCQEVF